MESKFEVFQAVANFCLLSLVAIFFAFGNDLIAFNHVTILYSLQAEGNNFYSWMCSWSNIMLQSGYGVCSVKRLPCLSQNPVNTDLFSGL